MSHTVCHDIGSWVNQNVNQQLEQCVEQDCNWWCLCCNKWFCFLVWIVVVIATWVVQTVCEVVADVIEVVVNIVVGIVDVLVGIFTFDWSRIVGGLVEIFSGPLVLLFNDILPIATLGSLVGAFNTAGKDWLLRDYVRGLIDSKYTDDPPEVLTRSKIKEALGVDSGGFGLRLQGRALRTFIRSDFSSQNDGTPDLIVWLNDKTLKLDLKALAGFNPPEWWKRPWPQLIGDSGDLSDVDLDNYVAKNGKGDDVKQFTLFSMSNADLQTRLDTATRHATELGLILQWNIEDVRLTEGDQVLMVPGSFASLLTTPPFSRHDSGDFAAAQAELCIPMVLGVFGFTDPTTGLVDLGVNGESAHLANSTCLETQSDGTNLFPPDRITGAACRDRKPDIAFKYSAIHELGHTFGLCHVDGLFRIMFTNAPSQKKSFASWSSVYQYWTSGLEAGFILDEGKKVWDYIIANFSSDCLKSRPF
jgi:hypothetical protein